MTYISLVLMFYMSLISMRWICLPALEPMVCTEMLFCLACLLTLSCLMLSIRTHVLKTYILKLTLCIQIMYNSIIEHNRTGILLEVKRAKRCTIDATKDVSSLNISMFLLSNSYSNIIFAHLVLLSEVRTHYCIK